MGGLRWQCLADGPAATSHGPATGAAAARPTSAMWHSRMGGLLVPFGDALVGQQPGSAQHAGCACASLPLWLTLLWWQRSSLEEASPRAVAARWWLGGSTVAVLSLWDRLALPGGCGVHYARAMRFLVLGPLEVEADDGPVVLGGRRNACCWPSC